MGRKLRITLGILAFCLAVLALCFVGRLLTDPTGKWLFTARPPLMEPARNIQTYYPSNDLERITEFASDQPADAIRQFYRSELPKHGWQYRCTVALPLETGVLPLDAEMDVYATPPPTPSPTPAATRMQVTQPLDAEMDVYERGSSRIRRAQTLEVQIYKPEPGAREIIGATQIVRLDELLTILPEESQPCSVR